jgi:hypothetical protein
MGERWSVIEMVRDANVVDHGYSEGLVLDVNDILDSLWIWIWICKWLGELP